MLFLLLPRSPFHGATRCLLATLCRAEMNCIHSSKSRAKTIDHPCTRQGDRPNSQRPQWDADAGSERAREGAHSLDTTASAARGQAEARTVVAPTARISAVLGAWKSPPTSLNSIGAAVAALEATTTLLSDTTNITDATRTGCDWQESGAAWINGGVGAFGRRIARLASLGQQHTRRACDCDGSDDSRAPLARIASAPLPQR